MRSRRSKKKVLGRKRCVDYLIYDQHFREQVSGLARWNEKKLNYCFGQSVFPSSESLSGLNSWVCTGINISWDRVSHCLVMELFMLAKVIVLRSNNFDALHA